MKSLLVTLILFICSLLTAAVDAQTLPYVANVRAEPGSLRGTLINPLSEPLSAWRIDAVDESGRPHVSQLADHLLVPQTFVPPKGRIEVQIMTPDTEVRTLTLRAALTANGMEVGELKAAFDLIDARFRRAATLETILDVLRSLDPGTPSEKVNETLSSLSNTLEMRAKSVLSEVRQKSSGKSAHAWIAVAEDLRNKWQTGAVRHGILRERLSRGQ